ncbi:MAG: hypothetical protein FWD11_11145 [Micrococcales bacterium]|nr:hypothetical protein [Micrococcales bacterium]
MFTTRDVSGPRRRTSTGAKALASCLACTFAVAATTVLAGCTSASPSEGTSTPAVTPSAAVSYQVGDVAEFDGVQYQWVAEQLDWPGITLGVGLFIPADFVANPDGHAGSWIRSDCATTTDGTCPTIVLEQVSDAEVDDEVALDGTVAASGVSWTVSELVAESFRPTVGPVVTVKVELCEPWSDSSITLNPYVVTHTYFPIGKGESGDYGQLVLRVQAGPEVADYTTFVDRTTSAGTRHLTVLSTEEK